MAASCQILRKEDISRPEHPLGAIADGKFDLAVKGDAELASWSVVEIGVAYFSEHNSLGLEDFGALVVTISALLVRSSY